MNASLVSSNSPSGRDYSSQLRVLEAWIEETPGTATAKGMYFESFLRMLEGKRVARPVAKRYVAFKDYPLTELMRLMVDATTVVHPDVPPKEGLRLLGQLAFPTLTSSTVGKVIFSIAGRSWTAALPLTERSYSVSVTGTAKLRDLTEHRAVLELRDIWNFPDSYHVGVLEGAMQSYNIEGSVRPTRLKRRCDVDLVLEWD